MTRNAKTPTRRGFVSLAAAAAIIPIAPEIAAPHPDAELLALREKLRLACDRFINEEGPEAPTLVRTIAAEIAVLPAQTLEGVQVKARALRWSYFGDEYFEPMDFDTAPGRLFVSLLQDLAKLGAG